MLEKGTVVFGNWTVEEEIGSGAFGTVYKIKREEFGRVYYSAMKVLHIPQDKDEHKRLRSEGMDDASISTYYSQVVQDFVSEIELLSSLDGITNIVDYKDHIIEPNDNLGYTIYIKMQLLTPVSNTLLNSDGSVRFMDVKEIIKLGVDMCSALEVCEKRNIIHRDIKIDNIFISENGDYKLGDFGIAKQLEATQGEMSKKGTLLYMAPEVFRGEKYDKTADIYSLGVVLYRLLNKNRAPFFPNYPDPIKFFDKETANTKRLKGDEFPDIIGISTELNTVLKKACAFNPKDRYLSANEFKAALNGVTLSMIFMGIYEPTTDSVAPDFEETTKDEATVGVFSDIPVVIVDDNSIDEDKTESVFDMTEASSNEEEQEEITPEIDESTVSAFSESVNDKGLETKGFNEIKSDKKKGILVVIIALILIAIGSGIFLGIKHFSGTGKEDSTKSSMTGSSSSKNDTPTSTETTSFFVYLDLGNGKGRKRCLMEEPGLLGIPTNPTRDGYIFAGWYSDIGLTDIWDFSTDIATEEMVIYAKWVAEDDKNLEDVLAQVPTTPYTDVNDNFSDNWYDENNESITLPVAPTKAPTQAKTTTKWSEWSEWSEWTTTPATKTDSCDVKTRTIYLYDVYHYECAFCDFCFDKLAIGVISHTYQRHQGVISQEAMDNLYLLFREELPENKTEEQVLEEAGLYYRTKTLYGIDEELVVDVTSTPYVIKYDGVKWYTSSSEPIKIETQYSIRTRKILK